MKRNRATTDRLLRALIVAPAAGAFALGFGTVGGIVRPPVLHLN